MAPPVFPALPGVAFPVKRSGPIFDTIVQDAVSGRQTALPKRVTPRWRWELSFDLLRTAGGFAEMQALAGFYAGCLGRAYPFAYTEAEDCSVTNQLFGLGDGTTKTFQLVRSLGGFVEPVFLPTGTPSILIGGAPATGYTLSASGRVTLASAPAQSVPLTWTGTFNWLCRFDEDFVPFTRFMSGLWSVESLRFSSILP